jgi:hypothetical protein
VRADLKPSTTPLGLELHVLKPVEVKSLDAEQPLPPHFQEFLERKFRGLFGQRFRLDGMQFPAGGALDGLSAFRIVSVKLEPQWVNLRYSNRKPQQTLVSADRVQVRAAKVAAEGSAGRQ